MGIGRALVLTLPVVALLVVCNNPNTRAWARSKGIGQRTVADVTEAYGERANATSRDQWVAGLYARIAKKLARLSLSQHVTGDSRRSGYCVVRPEQRLNLFEIRQLLSACIGVGEKLFDFGSNFFRRSVHIKQFRRDQPIQQDRRLRNVIEFQTDQFCLRHHQLSEHVHYDHRRSANRSFEGSGA